MFTVHRAHQVDMTPIEQTVLIPLPGSGGKCHTQFQQPMIARWTRKENHTYTSFPGKHKRKPNQNRKKQNQPINQIKILPITLPFTPPPRCSSPPPGFVAAAAPAAAGAPRAALGGRRAKAPRPKTKTPSAGNGEIKRYFV